MDKSIKSQGFTSKALAIKNIVTNDILRSQYLEKLNEFNIPAQTNYIIQKLSSLSNSTSINTDTKLNEAINRMFDNELTKYNTIQEYAPFELITREQAAKILVKFAQIFGFLTINENESCTFDDLKEADETLKPYIIQACQAQIMQGNEKKFSPKYTISKAQFITAIIRLLEGKKLDETSTPWWTVYFELASKMGIVNPADAITFDNPITRYEVALILYRFKIKYQISQNLNSNIIHNQIISTVS